MNASLSKGREPSVIAASLLPDLRRFWPLQLTQHIFQEQEAFLPPKSPTRFTGGTFFTLTTYHPNTPDSGDVIYIMPRH